MGNTYFFFPYTVKDNFSFCCQIYRVYVCAKLTCSFCLGMCCLMSLFSKAFLIICSHSVSAILPREKKCPLLAGPLLDMLYIEGSCWFFPIHLVIHTKQERRIPRLLVTSLNISSCFPIGLKLNQGIIYLPEITTANERCLQMWFYFVVVE